MRKTLISKIFPSLRGRGWIFRNNDTIDLYKSLEFAQNKLIESCNRKIGEITKAKLDAITIRKETESLSEQVKSSETKLILLAKDISTLKGKVDTKNAELIPAQTNVTTIETELVAQNQKVQTTSEKLNKSQELAKSARDLCEEKHNEKQLIEQDLTKAKTELTSKQNMLLKAEQEVIKAKQAVNIAKQPKISSSQQAIPVTTIIKTELTAKEIIGRMETYMAQPGVKQRLILLLQDESKFGKSKSGDNVKWAKTLLIEGFGFKAEDIGKVNQKAIIKAMQLLIYNGNKKAADGIMGSATKDALVAYLQK